MESKFNDIPGFDTWKSIEFVEKGWSDDKKYHIITDKGNHLLLRISDPITYEAKKEEFRIIQKLSLLEFEMSKAIDMGLCKEGVYMLLEWIQGRDLEEALRTLEESEQYRLGYEAGVILKKIHDEKIEIEAFSWEEKFNRKMDKKILDYQNCSLAYEKGQLFIDCIQRSRNLLANRPIALHHGDYHVGNMLLSQSGHIGIIDFNRFDYGDPWEEFNRIVWDIRASHAFAAGRVDGYFQNDVPDDFFQLLALYISSNTLSSLPWAVPFGTKQVEIMIEQARVILDDFDDFNLVIPKWYSEAKKRLDF